MKKIFTGTLIIIGCYMYSQVQDTLLKRNTDVENLYLDKDTLTLHKDTIQSKDEEPPELPSITQDTQIEGIRIVGRRNNNYVSKDASGSLRLETPIIEIPQNIQIINNNIIKDQQVTSLSDGLIKNISGVTRMEHWGDLYTRINMRGSRAAAFREGMNVTSNWGPLTEDMSFVERIEFVKGPAGFMMSNGEPSGIYNVVMKKPIKAKRNSLSLMLGSNDFYRAALDLGGKLEKTGNLLYRFNIYGQSNNSFRHDEFNKKFGISPAISYQIDENTLLTGIYTYQHVDMSNMGSYYSFSPTGYGTTSRDFTALSPGMEPTKVDDHSLTLNLQHDLSDNWKLTAQVAYFLYTQKGSSLWTDSLSQDGYLRRTISIGDAINEMKFGQVFVNGKVNTGKIRHRILAGVDVGSKEYWGDWGQTFQLDNANSFNVFSPGRGIPALGLPTFDRSRGIKERSEGSKYFQSYTGLYVQDELALLNEKLRVTLAARYTHAKDVSFGDEVEKNRITPRFGISYSLDDEASFYALYDQSFVPQSGNRRDKGKIEPILGNNIEVGAKKYWFNRRLNTTLSVYQITKKNQLSADPNNSPSESYVLQLGKTRTRGVEFDLQGKITESFIAIANYAFTESKITEDTNEYKKGTEVPGYAKHVMNFILKYDFSQGVLKNFGLYAGYTLQANRSTWGLAEGQAALPDYNRFDAGASWRNKKITINFQVYNLFDKYLYSGSTYNINGTTAYIWQTEASRNYRLGVTYNF